MISDDPTLVGLQMQKLRTTSIVAGYVRISSNSNPEAGSSKLRFEYSYFKVRAEYSYFKVRAEYSYLKVRAEYSYLKVRAEVSFVITLM